MVSRVDDEVRAHVRRVLREPVVGLEPLSEDGRRNYIARVHLAGGGSAIVKHRLGEGAERAAAFFDDWAGPAFLSALGADSERTPTGPPHAPRFLGGDASAGILVLEDVAHAGSLVDVLTGDDPAAAETALLALAERLGRLHADTAPRLDDYARLRAALDPATDGLGWFGRYARGPLRDDTLAALARIGLDVDAVLRDELDELPSAFAGAGHFQAYVHGDPCPDNVLWTATGPRLVDFEVGGIGQALLDGVYGEMAFPSCWCANRVPDSLVRRMELRYRHALARGCPAAADDRLFDEAYAAACVAWLLVILRVAGRPDSHWGIASVQQRLVYRAERVARVCVERGCLPAFGRLAERIAAWVRGRLPDLEPLPLYPAFR